MDRMTTDTPQNNTDSLLNLAYAENNWVKIRGMDEAFTEYIRRQCREKDCNLSELSTEQLCESVMECGFDAPQCPIFLLFATATQAAELRARLMDYENTGLTPEDVERVNTFAGSQCEKLLQKVQALEKELSEAKRIICETCKLRAQEQHLICGCYSCKYGEGKNRGD